MKTTNSRKSKKQLWKKEEGNEIKNIQGNRTPDYDICTRNKGRNIKNQTANEIEVLRKIVCKKKK